MSAKTGTYRAIRVSLNVVRNVIAFYGCLCLSLVMDVWIERQIL